MGKQITVGFHSRQLRGSKSSKDAVWVLSDKGRQSTNDSSLSKEQISIMFTIQSIGGGNMAEIANATPYQVAKVSRIVQELRHKGFVKSR